MKLEVQSILPIFLIMILNVDDGKIHEWPQGQLSNILFLVLSIGCFKCVSAGGDNPSCEDPFHNNMTLGQVVLEQPCMGGRKGRDGLFPASDCIKVTGYYGELNTKQSFLGICLLDKGRLGPNGMRLVNCICNGQYCFCP